jgi:hypothetical protein
MVCGCTELSPCLGGCIWANATATLCSKCTGGSYIVGGNSPVDDELEDPEMLAAFAELLDLEDDPL